MIVNIRKVKDGYKCQREQDNLYFDPSLIWMPEVSHWKYLSTLIAALNIENDATITKINITLY